MRALVTGAAGVIGSHLSRRLIADGVGVVALDDLSDGSLGGLVDVPEVRFVKADVCDEAAVADAARGCDAIFHEAAKRSVPRSMAFPGMTTDVNVRGTLNMLLAARESRAVVVAASSSSVFGDQDTFPLWEDMPPKPRSPYAASKVAGEVDGATLWRSYGVPYIGMRSFNVYRPRRDPESEYAAVIPRFVVAGLTGGVAEVHADGGQARDFGYIGDVLGANPLAARAPEAAYGQALQHQRGGAEPTRSSSSWGSSSGNAVRP